MKAFHPGLDPSHLLDTGEFRSFKRSRVLGQGGVRTLRGFREEDERAFFKTSRKENAGPVSI